MDGADGRAGGGTGRGAAGRKKKLRCLTTLGWLEAAEQTWRVGSRELRPVLPRLGIRPRGCSRGLQRVLTDFGADESFAAAAAKVREHYGVEVNAERVRQVCLHHAGRLAARPVEVCTRLRPRGAEWIVAEADGSMLPIVDTSTAPPGADRRKHRRVRWQEARVVAARALGQTRTHYDVTLGEVAEAGARWSRTVQAVGRGVNTRIHAVGDGAVWIEQQARTALGPNLRYLLDLYHVCDYLAAVWPNDRTVVAQHRESLKAGQLAAVMQALRSRLEPDHLPDEAAPARCALRYLENRPHQLDYPAALREGLPIGSGLIESAHRHLLQSRLKLAGAWWTQSHAQAMAQLRTCRANGKWHEYWQN